MESKSESFPSSPSDLKRDLQRLNRMLQAAHRSSIEIRNSYDFYILALKELDKEDLTEAYLYYDRSKYELTTAINDSKASIRGLKFHGSRTISYFFKLYGLYALVFGAFSAIFFAYLIFNYSEVTVLGVPLWSSFFAGLGASAQILTGLVDDLRSEGQATRYKRVWYTAIPLLSLIFGYITYLIFNSGLISFNVDSQSRIFSTMFLCFLTGFLTSWLIDKLSPIHGDD